MIRHNIKQNTPEWKTWRKNKIGASDAPIIMNTSPWLSPYEIWCISIGIIPEPITTSKMQRGHDLEPIARLRLMKYFDRYLEPVVGEHLSIPYMIASFDCMTKDGSVICEIKCPGPEDHKKAKAKIIPEKYIPQLQHQIEVAGVDKAYYYSFDGKNGELLEIYRDDAYIKTLIQAEKEFYDCLMDFIPPKMNEKDIKRWNLTRNDCYETIAI